MKSSMTPEINELIHTVHYRPSVSVILPFEPKMTSKGELIHQLKCATDAVEKNIRHQYSDEIAMLVIHKLRNIARNINFSTYKKSIAIFVSPVFEKVLYLDIAVEERITVNDSFEIRDLVYAKKEIHKYLVLVLSEMSCNVFLGNTNSFIRIKSNAPDHISDVINDKPQRVSNFSDPSERKEILLNKFLDYTDRGLGILLQSYQLPVFVLGARRVIGHFKKITKNDKSIIGYVEGNYETASESELHTVLKPSINDWKKVRTEELRLRLEAAADAGKLATGMKNVWRQASQHKGRLLVIEKNFHYPTEHSEAEGGIAEITAPYNKYSYIKDAVDVLIEKVLEHGGDVEFVDEGDLENLQHIALIQYY